LIKELLLEWMIKHMKIRLMLTALLALFLLAGCGGSNSALNGTQSQSAPGMASNPAGGYLNDNQDTEVLYIQWTESNGQLTGSWNDAILQNNSIAYTNLPFTGTHDNSTRSINFVINLGGAATSIHGTVQDSKLLLQMQKGGQSTSWTLHAASNIDYRSALTTFQSKYPGS
jgi:ABC-type glycerol-3-phosphate transport system substrate-binding protein